MWYLRVVKLCECRKKLVDKLVEEYSENVDEVEISGITLVEYENQCKLSCTLYTVLLSMIFKSTLELLLISFTRNTWNIVKKEVTKEGSNNYLLNAIPHGTYKSEISNK